ncbi:MAG: MarR family transcriptional regulator [Lacibacter sp.]
MSLEQDIQQKRSFRNDRHKAIVNLIYTHNWVLERLKDVLKEDGITPQQFNILRILRGSNGPISTLQIRERMLDKMSDTSRIVDRLITKELATKTVSKYDKRLVDVLISEKGLQTLKNIDEKQERLDQLMGNITYDEAASINILFDKIRGSN